MEWISVKDKEPKAGERILIVNIKNKKTSYVHQVNVRDCNRFKQRYSYTAPWYEIKKECTHWMPLPAPPEGEGGEGE